MQVSAEHAVLDRSMGEAIADKAMRQQQLTRAVVASAVGTTIEWYDFFLYGITAALVFPAKFFPASDPLVSTLLSFSTFFVGFVARPIGAALFGHYGDRVGRKSLLITTLVLMGTATVGIGLVPGYDSIGIWGAVLLTVGRLLQGLAVGGEWSGSVLMAAEWSEPKRRGLTTSFAQIGAPAGMVLANGALMLTTMLVDERAFHEWGWRIPFLASAVLLLVGFYIRVGILESPVFAQLKKRGKVVKTPVADVLRRNGREVLLSALLRTGQHVPYYIFTTYILAYGTQILGLSRATLLSFVIVQSVVSLITIPLAGHFSDRFGRRLVTGIGCALMLVFPFLYFNMVDSRNIVLVFLAIVLSTPVHDLQYGPQAAFIAESFPGTLRYSGSALGYHLASITAGGPAPMIATMLYAQFHTSTAIAAYISVSALISLICVFALKHKPGSLDDQ
jgi:metabolite-proton symporter